MKQPIFALAALLLAGAFAPATSAPAPAPVVAPIPNAPAPGTLAVQPDARDFFARADAALELNGRPRRLAGMNVSWLGLFTDPASGQRHPTDYEVRDIFDTAFQMGGGIVRSNSLGMSAGCANCVINADGSINQDAVRHIDHVLKLAHDAGIALIIPLIGGSGPCAPGAALDPVRGAACGFARAQGKADRDFFTDTALRETFLRTLTSLLNHINPERSIAWKDEPAILAWENCDRCGNAASPEAISAWTEAVGASLKSIDSHHLYENGAFAGRLEHIAPSLWATPSVDIVGDWVMPRPGAAADGFIASEQAVIGMHRIYIIDGYGWSPATWPSVDAFQGFIDALTEQRSLSAAIVQSLSGHADQGGFLPVPLGDDPVLFYPGTAAEGMDADEMHKRSRAVRRLSFQLMDMVPPTFGITPAPEIIAAQHGKVTWRGAAGSIGYSISRSKDILAGGSWQVVCEECVTDATPSWQDPQPPQGTVYYRMNSFNANDHIGHASAPVKNQ